MSINKRNITFVIAVVLIVLLSELIFTVTHKEIYNSYLLKTAVFLSDKNMNFSFLTLTEGSLRLPQDEGYKKSAEEYLTLIPPNRNLQRVYYDLAIIASAGDQPDLTPKLLDLSIKVDPDFSFWRVELANYYFRNKMTAMGLQVLEDCQKLPGPRDHCREYRDSVHSRGWTENIGFLADSINTYYETYGN